MRVAMLRQAGEVVIEEAPMLAPSAGEVLIEVAYAGVCGSDLHSFEGTHPFRQPPVVLGHEVAGTIAALGEGVTGLTVGQAVTVMPYTHCGVCAQCRLGRTNTCLNKVVPGLGGWQGTFAEYFVSRAEIVYPLDQIGLRRGVLAEPLAVGVHAARRGLVGPGTRALVLGGGTIGLFTALAAHLAGAESVALTDLSPHNLALARVLGADDVYDASDAGLVPRVRSDYLDGFDVVFLASAAKATVAQALALARRGGRIVIIALFAGAVPLVLSDLTVNELDLVGTQIYTDEDFRTALSYLAAAPHAHDGVITHELPLEQAQEALALMLRRDEPVVKVLLRP